LIYTFDVRNLVGENVAYYPADAYRVSKLDRIGRDEHLDTSTNSVQALQNYPKSRLKNGVILMAKKYIEDTNIEYLPDTPENRKWLKEVAAYDAMWKNLLNTHEGKFVAIHNGEVVDCDDDETALLKRVLGKYKPLYVEQVLKTRYREYVVPRADID
jgi:hypothetical protein